MLITLDQIQQIIPAAKPADIEKYFAPLQVEMAKFEISTPQQIGGFVAQIGHESAHFSTAIEGASGKEYEGRLDLGNSEPGDGVKFKGRGLIQITGRGNYESLSFYLYKDHRLTDTPELLQEPELAVTSACWFWCIFKPLNKVCNHSENWIYEWHGKNYTKIQWMTLLVNGGQNGIDERTANYQRARKVLNF